MKMFSKSMLRILILGAVASLFAACGGAPAGTVNNNNGGNEVDGDGNALILQLGSGGGSSFSAGNLTATLAAAGATPSWRINAVVADVNGIAVTDVYTVEFSSTCVTSELSSFDAASAETSAGRTSVVYTAGTCDGTDTIQAAVDLGNNVFIRASVDIDIDGARGGGTTGSARLGVGSGSDFVAGQLSAVQPNLSAGGSTTITASIVDSVGNPIVESVPVSFSSACVSTGLATINSPVNSSGGFVSTIYTASGCSGSETINATATVDGAILSASVELTIATDTVLGVQFSEVSQSTLAIAGIGGEETAVVTFRLVGAQGAPIVGEEVTFELSNSAGGSRIAAGTETASSDNEGFASTVVQSGTVNSTLRVIATHTTSGTQGFSDDITVSTGVPVSRSFDLGFSRQNPPAAARNGQVVSLVVNAADQFGNPPPDGTRVSFRSVEFGIIEPSCSLTAGECTVDWESSGSRGFITPDTLGRPMRVSVIAFMSGAEDYIDFNGNGFFDSNNADEVASVVDLPEAFTDQNEDGVHNPGEDFVDSFLNNPTPTATVPGGINGSYDNTGDGEYNGPCSTILSSNCPLSELQTTIIYREGVIVLSGDVAAICDLGSMPTAGTTLDLTDLGQRQMSGVTVCDTNGNSLPDGTTATWVVDGASLGGITTTDIPSNTTEPRILPNARIEDVVDPSGFLELRVEAPSGELTVFEWPWTN